MHPHFIYGTFIVIPASAIYAIYVKNSGLSPPDVTSFNDYFKSHQIAVMIPYKVIIAFSLPPFFPTYIRGEKPYIVHFTK